jgi:hypothetical protein
MEHLSIREPQGSDIYFNDDQSESMVVERYRDCEALIEHMANLGDLGGRSSAADDQATLVIEGGMSHPRSPVRALRPNQREGNRDHEADDNHKRLR